MKDRGFLIKIMVVLIILIVIIVITLSKLDKNKKNIDSNVIINNQNQDKVLKVSSYNDYYSVKNAVEKYLIFLSMNNNEAVYSLLDKEYTEKNKITIENVIDKIEPTIKTELLIKEITYEKESEYNNIYYVKGYIYEENENEYDLNFDGILERDYEDFSITVRHDKYNMTFSIIPD